MPAGAGDRPEQNSGPRRPDRRRWLLCGGAALTSPLLRPAAAAEPALSFGLTPVFLDNDQELLAALEGYLAVAVGRPVRLIQRRTYQEVTALLLSGQLDAAWICGYPYVQYRERLSLLAVPVWRGRPLYRSYLIVSGDRPAEDIEDLRGDVHAFSDPDSNSGFLVTQSELALRGERPAGFFHKTFFTYSHRNVVRAVASGLADSGSVDGYVWEVMQELEPALTGATRVVARSDWLGFPPIATTHPLRDDPRVVALAEALWRMARDPAGAAILATLRLDGFEPAEPPLFDGILARYEAVQGLG